MAKMGKKKSIKKLSIQKKTPSISAKKDKTSTPKKAGKATKGNKKTSNKTIRNIRKPKSNLVNRRSTGKLKGNVVQTRLTAQDLDHFRGLLIDKLHEILGDVNWIEKEALRKSRQDAAGDLSTMPIHMADLGTDNYEQEFSLGLMDSERKIVHEILDALKRIALGTYGICEGTGQPIPRARLEANPWARFCVEYASLIEQGKVVENTYSGSSAFEEEGEEDREDADQDSEEENDFLYEEEKEEEETEGESALTGGLLYEEEPDEEEQEEL